MRPTITTLTGLALLLSSPTLLAQEAATAAAPAPKTTAAPTAAPAAEAPAQAEPTAEPGARPAPAEAPGEAEPPQVQPVAAEPAPAVPATAAAAAETSAEPAPNSYHQGNLVEEEPDYREDLLVGLLWEMAVPLGTSSDFVSTYSVQGFGVDIRYYALGNLAFGGQISWQTMSQKEVETYTRNNLTLTGTQVHELSTTPFLAKVYYGWRDTKPVVPYVSLGIGGNRVVRRVDAGISRLVDESWHWTLVPEVGVEVPLSKMGSLLVNSRLNYLFESGDGPQQIYMNFNVGFGFL